MLCILNFTFFFCRSNSLDEFILIEGEKLQNDIKLDGIKYSENDIKSLENFDKDLLQCALNLKYECNTCKKVFAREIRYQNHIEFCGLEYKLENNNKEEKIILPKLQCQYCMKTFKLQKYLNYHINIAHKVPFYTCEICQVKLKTKRSYSYHKLTKHSDTKHICPYCGKRFVTETSLKLHINIHTNRDTTQCICPVCGKTFHYKGGLFYHMKQHTNERKYKCEFCDKNFYTLFAKQRHVRTHTGVRPYACNFCEKKFFSLGERKRHEYIHTGTLPYRCQYCDKGFTSKYNLKVHWFNHTGDFTCEVCNRRFIDNEVLQFHYKVKHKIISNNEDNH